MDKDRSSGKGRGYIMIHNQLPPAITLNCLNHFFVVFVFSLKKRT